MFTCPECGYETEDSKSRTCPECGYNGDWIQPWENSAEDEECTFSKFDYSSYGCDCARCEREKYPDV